jgi:signal transduction histidine kinase
MRSEAFRKDSSETPAVTPREPTARRELEPASPEFTSERCIRGMQHLVTVVQRLSLARNLETVMAIVRRAARELTGADGATFVLRDEGRCYYADEDAISPLWKGQHFPMNVCISGWAMLNRQPAGIEDIYQDDRIPHDAYRPTFVKSLVIVPIRRVEPIGAIGTYWATRRKPSPEDIGVLQALADSASIAMEAVEVFQNLEKRVAERTAELKRRSTELELLNRELETFSYSVAHDLRAPLITIDGFTQVLAETLRDRLDDNDRGHLNHIQGSVSRMHKLIEDLLGLSKIVRAPMLTTTVDLTAMARDIATRLKHAAPERRGEFVIASELTAEGDTGLLRTVLDNLLANAWKFTSKRAHALIEIGATTDSDGECVYFARDNGAGFDTRYAGKLFGPFQRCHSQTDFPGTGIGLATCQRIVHRHGGKIWTDAQVDRGATFYFTLPSRSEQAAAG